jgi:hypothetical protein
MTARAFCLQRHINPSRFYHWRLRLREHHDNGSGFRAVISDRSCSVPWRAYRYPDLSLPVPLH